ncbi:spermidine/putrescine ABC transporter substrate-binding protein [uncultured Ruminococcus sp.]|uniref:polyamine ABC transporter substrate-binding protein n=1 Tax=uncultured Ruminococcus sp. TaxID=165186 RepID=UPI0025FAA2E2|nr:spermidine/putrescine ABC transporter substrate-binding protein [uncultured Ruminococcus sp.]
MKNFKKKKYFSLIAAAVMAVSLVSCSSEKETVTEDESESTEAQTLTVSDPEYYTKFKDQNISINVYNWGEYISTGAEEGTLNVNSEFTKLTGIKVNYTNYATNEELYAKLKGGGASYDIIIPSDYMINKMIKEGMVQKLDFDNIPNFKYIMPNFRNLEYDPENEYSVPYTWGTVGIIYDETMVDIPQDEIDWDLLWNEDYADNVLMFDNPRDAFAIAEIKNGFSLNTEDPEELKAAAEDLTAQKKIVQAYVMDEIFDKMGAGDALIAPYYAGDALAIMEENDSLNFVVPKSGTNLFVDAMCIPASSKQKEAAEMYINFMCEPDIAYANIDHICYSTPNSAAFEMLDEEVSSNPISYPDDEFIADKTTVFVNLSDEANMDMQTLWTEMKSAQDENENTWIMPVFLIWCIVFMVIVQIRRHIKSKQDIF